jgi:hypothetical protein
MLSLIITRSKTAETLRIILILFASIATLQMGSNPVVIQKGNNKKEHLHKGKEECLVAGDSFWLIPNTDGTLLIFQASTKQLLLSSHWYKQSIHIGHYYDINRILISYLL